MAARAGGRVLATVVALAAVGMVLAGCDTERSGNADVAPEPPAATERPRPGGRLVYGLEADPNGLDPTRNAFDRAGVMLANALYDPVAAFDRDGNVQPYLVERFEPNATYTEWRFFLRPGVRFHSGAPLDADAVINFGEAIRDSAVTGSAARSVREFVKVDDLTVLIRMSKPWSTFPVVLTGQAGYVVSPAQLDDDDGEQRPDGTGPFRLQRWDVGQRFELVRNVGYWQPGKPYLDSVSFEVIADGADRLARLRSGYLDVISANNAAEVQAMREAAAQGDDSRADRIRVERDDGPADNNFIMFNTAVPPLDDVRVRRALAHATDREALARDHGWSVEDLVDGPFHRDSPWYAPSEPPAYDPARARQLLGEYQRDQQRRGRDGSVELTLLVSYDIPVVQQLVEQWARVGVTATIEQIDFKRHIVQAVAGLYDAEYMSYLGAADPDALWHFFSSDTWAPVNSISLNITRLRDDEIDRAIDAGRSTTDVAERKEAYAAFQRRLAELVPYIWLYRSPWHIATSGRVRDIHNVALPDGQPALPYLMGTHRLTETWIAG